MHPVSQYAARVRAARGYANLTQKELAERLGVDEQTIKRREKETGGQEPKLGERIAIATICDVPPSSWRLASADPPKANCFSD